MPRQFRFGRTMAVIALGAMLGLAANAGLAAEKLVVARSSTSGFTFDPLNIGIDKGIYTKNGLDVQMSVLEGSAKLHQAMLAGELDIGLGAGTDLAYLVKGSPETAVGAIMLGAGIYGLVIGPDSNIHSVADLKGKKIGVSTNKLVAERPDAIRSFLKSWYETVSFMRANRDETVKLARALDGFAQEVDERNYDVVMPFMSSDGKFPDAGLEAVRGSFVDLGILPSEPDVSK